ncbi:MAG TPA: hypothetical protein VLW47_08530 [Thermodesulfobacteriota bacterium]|nr:hypothetical protein [Thermodesulfobacteriota bacterium]
MRIHNIFSGGDVWKDFISTSTFIRIRILTRIPMSISTEISFIPTSTVMRTITNTFMHMPTPIHTKGTRGITLTPMKVSMDPMNTNTLTMAESHMTMSNKVNYPGLPWATGAQRKWTPE